jgi:tetratricopeptide (TPR) repeat protein
MYKVNDPVLKDRIVFTGDLQPAKNFTLTIIGIVVISVLGAGAYFYHDTIQSVISQFSKTQMAEAPEKMVPEAISPVVTAEKNTADTKPPLGANIYETVSPIVSSDASPRIELSNLPKSHEEAVQPELSNDSSASIVLSSPSKSHLEVRQPAEVEKPSSASTVAVAQSETVAKQVSDSVESLLAKAKTQIASRRFTTPADDNAYETYQQLLEKAPLKAQLILDNIVAWYFDKGKEYVKNGKLIRSRNRGNAYKMYKKMREIAPQHQKTQNLQHDIILALDKQALNQIEKDKSKRFYGNNIYVIYQGMLAVASTHEKTQRLLETLVYRLLATAEKQMNKKDYTTPKNDNATDTYRKILEISPENIEAKNGIKKIVKEYYQLANTNKRIGQYTSSMSWIKRGLYVDPDNPDLAQLKQEVEALLSK